MLRGISDLAYARNKHAIVVATTTGFPADIVNRFGASHDTTVFVNPHIDDDETYVMCRIIVGCLAHVSSSRLYSSRSTDDGDKQIQSVSLAAGANITCV